MSNANIEIVQPIEESLKSAGGDSSSMLHEHILASMDNGVIALDFEGKIITFNPAAAKILGIQADFALGKYYPEVFFELPGNDDFNDILPCKPLCIFLFFLDIQGEFDCIVS